MTMIRKATEVGRWLLTDLPDEPQALWRPCEEDRCRQPAVFMLCYHTSREMFQVARYCHAHGTTIRDQQNKILELEERLPKVGSE